MTLNVEVYMLSLTQHTATVDQCQLERRGLIKRTAGDDKGLQEFAGASMLGL